MKFIYCLLTQTVSVEISHEEIDEMREDARERLKSFFTGLVKNMKSELGELKEKLNAG